MKRRTNPDNLTTDRARRFPQGDQVGAIVFCGTSYVEGVGMYEGAQDAIHAIEDRYGFRIVAVKTPVKTQAEGGDPVVAVDTIHVADRDAVKMALPVDGAEEYGEEAIEDPVLIWVRPISRDPHRWDAMPDDEFHGQIRAALARCVEQFHAEITRWSATPKDGGQSSTASKP